MKLQRATFGLNPPGPPMTLGNMREQGVQHPIAYCLNDGCRHQALIRSVELSAGPRMEPIRSRVRTL
jgi:transposase